MLRRGAVIVVVSWMFLAPGCRDDPKAEGDESIQVVCTVGMLTDVVREVAGDRAEVTGLMRSGIDPHLYRPTRSDIALVRGADLVFCVGLHLEGRMSDLFDRGRKAGQRVCAVGERVPESELFAATDYGGSHDPHLWMDPRLWSRVVERVRAELSELDPQGAEGYAARANAYREELDRLYAYAREVTRRVPAERRVLLTAHDAFAYFGRAYDFEVVGIQGISTESEAGLRDLERLVDLIVERRVPAVFVESTVSDKGIRSLIAGARERGFEVRVGGELYSDAMGPEGTYEGTYIGMIDHNVTTIATSLGAQPEPVGFAEHLSR